jgi:cellulose synthase/poly-beta-1,6-N-acetylglucosamine synthase-like glycosyltransferase
MSLDAAQRRLEQLSRRIAAHRFVTRGESVRLSPALGYTALTAGSSGEELIHRAHLALENGVVQLDLHPVRYEPSMESTARGKAAHGPAPSGDSRWVTIAESLRVPFQILVTVVVGLVIPLLIYALWGTAGMNIAPTIYLIVVVVMLLTATLITLEGFLALRAGGPPEEPGAPYPAASAIIAAYLPNEAPVIIDTIEAFLRVNYPEPLQVILAYNTPKDMPIEEAIQAIARRDPRFTAIRVESSSSKAQNVNAALALVNGEFVGVFDADHHPDPDSFTRAWRWLSNGYDVVQGHCLVRNGDASWVARLAAVEFETIYAVSHPGRARLHGFGVFGGSNGYWRTERLRQTRMRGWMLTEDIDSSMRVVQDGGKIASDPKLISRELAPVTLSMLWHQRMRWAQGWFQVSFRHLEPALRSPHLSLRQKLGLVQLLGWREFYPWLSLQIIPILVYHIWWRGQAVDWLAPLFLFATLVMFSNRPAQVLFAYHLAHPEIRRRKGWWVSYFILSLLFYMEFKNVIARVAHIKEVMHERKWIVTPRAREQRRGDVGGI